MINIIDTLYLHIAHYPIVIHFGSFKGAYILKCKDRLAFVPETAQKQ